MKRIALVVVLALALLTACAGITEQTGVSPEQQVGVVRTLIEQAIALLSQPS